MQRGIVQICAEYGLHVQNFTKFNFQKGVWSRKIHDPYEKRIKSR